MDSLTIQTQIPLTERISASLASREARQMLRRLAPIVSKNATLIDFSSNDYLSLSKSQDLSRRFKTEFSSSSFVPYGPASSRLLDGNTNDHLALEKYLVHFFNDGKGDGLLFNSGYEANVGMWSCLPHSKDVIIYDELIHASVHDGMRKSRIPARFRWAFRHNDINHLERLLQQIHLLKPGQENSIDGDVWKISGDIWIAVESLYSMDGDLCPLDHLVELIDKYVPSERVHIVVDEAHSSGLYGTNGRGLTHALNLIDKVRIRLHTFGKAFSCGGAVLLCDERIRSFLINYARPLIYSTALARMNILAIKAAVEHVHAGLSNDAILNLKLLCSRFVSQLEILFKQCDSSLCRLHTITTSHTNLPSRISQLPLSPIIPVLTKKPRPLSAFLIDQGYLVRPITYPTVPKGEERVRICIHAGNTIEEIEGLVKAFAKWIMLESGQCRL